MTHWESLNYKDQPYVKISPRSGPKAKQPMTGDNAGDMRHLLCGLGRRPAGHAQRERAETGRSTANWPARPKAKDKAEPTPAAGKPWLGSNVGLQVDRKALEVLSRLGRDAVPACHAGPRLGQPADPQRVEARYPDQDPVELHERVWHIRAGLSGRRQVRLEREVADDGIDRLRPSGRAEERPSRPARPERASPPATSA